MSDKRTCTYNGEVFEEIADGYSGVVYRSKALIKRDKLCSVCTGLVTGEANDDQDFVIKHPVSEIEIDLTIGHVTASKEYSAGSASKILIKINGYNSIALKMGYIRGELLKDRFKYNEKTMQQERPLLTGENIIFYLILAHVTLQLCAFRISDTGKHNCICQGAEETFMIFLIDTGRWRLNKITPRFILNFSELVYAFKIYRIDDLKKETQFIKKCLDGAYDHERDFINDMMESCFRVADNFLEMETSLHYHERIYNLLYAIEKASKRALLQLETTLTLEDALKEGEAKTKNGF